VSERESMCVLVFVYVCDCYSNKCEQLPCVVCVCVCVCEKERARVGVCMCVCV